MSKARSRVWLRAQIIRWVSDEPQPGIVECRFTDRFDKEWAFIEKVAVVTDANVWNDSQFPQPAWLGCEVVSRGVDGTARETAQITTKEPWGIEAIDGTTEFEVFRNQLTADPE